MALAKKPDRVEQFSKILTDTAVKEFMKDKHLIKMAEFLQHHYPPPQVPNWLQIEEVSSQMEDPTLETKDVYANYLTIHLQRPGDSIEEKMVALIVLSLEAELGRLEKILEKSPDPKAAMRCYMGQE